MIKIIRYFIIIILIFSVFVFYLIKGPSLYRFSNDGVVFIKMGYSYAQVINTLIKKHVIPNNFLSKEIAKILQKNISLPKFGEYVFRDGISMYDALLEISSGDSCNRKIVIIGGASFEEVQSLINNAKRLSGTDVDISEIKDVCILPDTYFYKYGDTKKQVLERMKKIFYEFMENEFKRRDKKCFLSSIKEVIILASIVEKESSKEEERRIVASVYLNRLKKNMRLQSCPTILFLTKKQVIYQSDLFIVSKYNTYRNKGLPCGPICIPSKSSILAVLYPSDTDYLYFASDGMGRNVFSKDFIEHKVIKRRYYKKGT